MIAVFGVVPFSIDFADSITSVQGHREWEGERQTMRILLLSKRYVGIDLEKNSLKCSRVSVLTLK